MLRTQRRSMIAVAIDMIVQSQAPARVDLAGGTLDIWPLYLFHENSQTINFAIDCYARCRISARRDGRIEIVSRDLRRGEEFASFDELQRVARGGKLRLPLPALLIREFTSHAENLPGLTLEMESGVPTGSGLGGSSALNIAICGALSKFTQRFTGKKFAPGKLPGKLIEIARNVESQVLGVPAGEQDYYSAMFGGVQAIHLTPHGIEPEKLPVSPDEMNNRFVLCYTGQSRQSGINNWEVEKAHIDGRRDVVRHFARIAAIAAEMRSALIEHDWRAVARLAGADWAARKKAWPGITTEQIDRLIDIAKHNGAWAGKACGAGGGGCVAFLVEPEAKGRVAAALTAARAQVLPARVAPRGLQVRTEK
ncbi:MAG: GHMP kinase [Acidobacteria bacterium]|nr:GHMP kinase [Acidobacteriota bacterium]